jgi:hypothetical protein
MYKAPPKTPRGAASRGKESIRKLQLGCINRYVINRATNPFFNPQNKIRKAKTSKKIADVIKLKLNCIRITSTMF